MESELIAVSPDEKEKIRKYYNTNESQIKEDIELIKTWIEKQPHLPQDLTDDFIEKNLLRNKFRIERTKKKLDNYYTLRGKNRDLLYNYQDIIPSKHVTTFLPMPKLTPNLERIYIMKIINPDPERYDIYEVVKINLAIAELTMQFDYSVGVRFLFDFGDFSLKHLMRANPILINKHVNLLEQAYSCRILGFELVNFPSFASQVLAIFKLVLRPKIYERVRIHDDINSVYEIIPRECLPSDYGGTLSNIPELLEKWDVMVKNHHNFFVENYEKISQEHLRLPELNNDAFGVDGTFKKLAID